MTGTVPVIVAIDPGREKCGVALLAGAATLERQVVPTTDLAGYLADRVGRHAVRVIVLGSRTGAAGTRDLLMQRFPALRVVTVEEEGTTLEARRLYFADHPPQGWRRLIPRSLLVPPEPYDDYAAVILGRRFLARGGSGERRGSP